MINYPALSPNHSRQQFPRKLYDLLENANPAVVAWLVDGMSFCIHGDGDFWNVNARVALSRRRSFESELARAPWSRTR